MAIWNKITGSGGIFTKIKNKNDFFLNNQEGTVGKTLNSFLKQRFRKDEGSWEK
jgi:hypothetical protein